MKRRNKWLIAGTILVVVIAGGVCVVFQRTARHNQPSADDIPEAETLMLPHYEIAVSAPVETPDAPETPDLLAKIKRAGQAMVLATLPPGSAVVGKTDLRLQGEHAALVAGAVETPAASGRKAKRYHFQIEVRFLPTGDTECAFPEFEER